MACSIKTTTTVLWQLSVVVVSPGGAVSRVKRACRNNFISFFFSRGELPEPDADMSQVRNPV